MKSKIMYVQLPSTLLTEKIYDYLDNHITKADNEYDKSRGYCIGKIEVIYKTGK
jgi:hypothetical protein